MKIATLYRKDGKVILETDNDAITQVATDSPQDVVVEQDVPPQGIAALRQIATELRTRHVAGCNGPSPTLVTFADRIDAAIRGRAMVKHQLREKGDPGLPDVLTDRNGDIALGMCKVCGQAEAELADSCPGINLEEFRPLARWVSNCAGHGINAGMRAKGERLLVLIDGQADPLCVKKLADCQYPKCGCNDRPTLCDLCQVREEVRSDAEGVPFCQECWDGWQAEEAKAVQP